MNCKEAWGHLWAFCEGSLGAADRGRLEEHLARCPGCSAERVRIDRTMRAMGALGEIEPRADFQERLWQRIDAWEGRKGTFWLAVVAGFIQRNRRFLATSLVAFCLALFGGLFVMKGIMAPGGQVADRGGTGYEGIALDAAKGAGAGQDRVRSDFVLREIPYQAPLATVSGTDPADTIYVRFPTRNLTPPGGMPAPTYVYEPVVTPVGESEPIF
jgi:hypothetical protein